MDDNQLADAAYEEKIRRDSASFRKSARKLMRDLAISFAIGTTGTIIVLAIFFVMHA